MSYGTSLTRSERNVVLSRTRRSSALVISEASATLALTSVSATLSRTARFVDDFILGVPLVGFLLLQTGDYLLLQDGGRIIRGASI